MLGLNIIGNIVGGITNYFTDGQKQSAKLKQAKVDEQVAISKAKTDMLLNSQDNDFRLDLIAVQNMNKSYKDEYYMVMFSIPMILAFIPGMQEIATTGFKIIAGMPDWYQYLVIGMVVVTFGMRGMLKQLLGKVKLKG